MMAQVVHPHQSHDLSGGVVCCHRCLTRTELALPCPFVAEEIARLLDRIGNVARQLAGTVVMECGTGRVHYANDQAAAIEADLGKLREML